MLRHEQKLSAFSPLLSPLVQSNRRLSAYFKPSRTPCVSAVRHVCLHEILRDSMFTNRWIYMITDDRNFTSEIKTAFVQDKKITFILSHSASRVHLFFNSVIFSFVWSDCYTFKPVTLNKPVGVWNGEPFISGPVLNRSVVSEQNKRRNNRNLMKGMEGNKDQCLENSL